MEQNKQEIAAFLVQHAPFDRLKTADLMAVAAQSFLLNCEEGHLFFKAQEVATAFLYVVEQGVVDIFLENHGEVQLFDRCGEGDLFGARPLMGDLPYMASAVAKEQSLIILIPYAVLRPILERNALLALFFAASYASGQRNPLDPKRPGQVIGAARSQRQSEIGLPELQLVRASRSMVMISPTTSIQNVGQLMLKHKIGSLIVVNDENHPTGIVTDRDLRNKVIAPGLPIDYPVSEIMTSPVVTIHQEPNMAEVHIRMLQYGVHHLCVTEDGSPQSPALHILSQYDLLVAQGSSPATIIRQMGKADKPLQLRLLRERAEGVLETYLEKGLSIDYVAKVMAAINKALITRAIELSRIELEAETGHLLHETQFAWLGLGSEGRGEQLLRTDQDNALVFIEKNEAEIETTRQVYLAFARKVTAILDVCGIVYCPGDMMASNPKWCLTLEEWKTKFSQWIEEPSPISVLNSSVFFDFTAVFGASHLAEKMTTHIFEALDKKEIFLSFLAKDALKSPPPLGFFRNILLERNKEHKDQFDVKGRAMLPLADAARVLVLHRRIGEINNTPERFRALAAMEPSNAELFEQAADSYEVLMRLRAENGLKNQDDGRFFKLEDLSKLDRLTLKNCFEPIQDLQKMMTIRFQLTYF